MMSCTCRGSPAPTSGNSRRRGRSRRQRWAPLSTSGQCLPLEARANQFARPHIAIALALRDSTSFDFDQFFELNVVLIAQMHLLFILWTFLSGRLDALHAWQRAHTDTSRSVHDRDLNRAAGLSTVLRACPLRRGELCWSCSSRGCRGVSHLDLDIVAFIRRCSKAVTMAMGPETQLSGGTADAHFRHQQGSVGFDVDTSSSR
ncbi:hypothetical protein EDB92DRAFT_1877481 [Lactarius akahatsu]|uniref:Uncharacterized protein n=1 Tax=Lactarius akahatsu TaxID=416441 RepID=A0AAD4QB76_9AGAM|nr:hypothetical protein EDB92DRAFT_1877481 [Lactarius akahatsu]